MFCYWQKLPIILEGVILKVTLKCSTCGGNQFEGSDDGADDPVLTCDHCGFEAKRSALVAANSKRIKKIVLDDLTSDLRRAFKRFK